MSTPEAVYRTTLTEADICLILDSIRDSGRKELIDKFQLLAFKAGAGLKKPDYVKSGTAVKKKIGINSFDPSPEEIAEMEAQLMRDIAADAIARGEDVSSVILDSVSEVSEVSDEADKYASGVIPTSVAVETEVKETSDSELYAAMNSTFSKL